MGVLQKPPQPVQQFVHAPAVRKVLYLRLTATAPSPQEKVCRVQVLLVPQSCRFQPHPRKTLGEAEIEQRAADRQAAADRRLQTLFLALQRRHPCVQKSRRVVPYLQTSLALLLWSAPQPVRIAYQRQQEQEQLLQLEPLASRAQTSYDVEPAFQMLFPPHQYQSQLQIRACHLRGQYPM